MSSAKRSIIMLDYVIQQKGHVLTNINPAWLSNDRIKELCRSVHQKGSSYDRCFGFVNCTVKGICRPTFQQREVHEQSIYFLSSYIHANPLVVLQRPQT